jgi:hypothetical protein
MRCNLSLSLILVLTAIAARAAEPPREPDVIARPDAFKTLDHPNCSHCAVEAKRRKEELRADDRVLCWVQVFTDGYINDGAIPIRFFLNTHRVLMDGWGVFAYDPDAGFARGFDPAGGPYRFHGWRNGVMVMKGKDGTVFSCLTGVGVEGPRKGTRLEPRPTLVSDWGFWQKRYPQSVAYFMYDKYKPVDLPTEVNEDSRKSRGPADGRLPADTMVLGVWDGKQARAYPLDVLEKAGVIQETANGQPRVVLWYGPTRTAAAYRQPFGTSGLAGDAGWVFKVDPKAEEATPFVDERTGSHWDVTGRTAEGGPRLAWLDSVQVKWFAWAAEYPDTSIYGKAAPEPDYKPMTDKSPEVAGALGNLDVAARHFAILKGADARRQRVTLLVDGETEPRVWPVRPGAELWCAGWWGRLDQFTVGDRVWVWFDTDRGKQPVAVGLLADELSEQDLYAPVRVKEVSGPSTDQGTVTLETVRGGKPTVRTVKLAGAEVVRGDDRASRDSLKGGEMVHVQTTGEDARLILDPAAFEKRRAEQKTALRKRWADAGLPGALVFTHPESQQVEVMLDHEAMRWGRSLQAGDKVTLQAANPIPAVVRQLRPWRERTQVLLGVEGSDLSAVAVGQRVSLRLASQPATDDDQLPPGLGLSQSKPERIEWLMAGVHCTCGMHDGCAGHFFTLAACESGGKSPCGLAKRTREDIAELIDKGKTDREIFEELLEKRGPTLLRPHGSP